MFLRCGRKSRERMALWFSSSIATAFMRTSARAELKRLSHHLHSHWTDYLAEDVDSLTQSSCDKASCDKAFLSWVPWCTPLIACLYFNQRFIIDIEIDKFERTKWGTHSFVNITHCKIRLSYQTSLSTWMFKMGSWHAFIREFLSK